jgi:hypothetical protein
MTGVDAPEHGVDQCLNHLSTEFGGDQRPYRSVAKFPPKIMAGSHDVETYSKEPSKREDPRFG